MTVVGVAAARIDHVSFEEASLAVPEKDHHRAARATRCCLLMADEKIVLHGASLRGRLTTANAIRSRFLWCATVESGGGGLSESGDCMTKLY